MAKKKTNKSKSTTKKKPAKKDTKDLVKKEYSVISASLKNLKIFRFFSMGSIIEQVPGSHMPTYQAFPAALPEASVCL